MCTAVDYLCTAADCLCAAVDYLCAAADCLCLQRIICVHQQTHVNGGTTTPSSEDPQISKTSLVEANKVIFVRKAALVLSRMCGAGTGVFWLSQCKHGHFKAEI